MIVIRSRRRVCLACALGTLLSLSPAVAASGDEERHARLNVADVQVPVTPLPAWDVSSPQKLVRIEGDLYQEDRGFYFRVVEDVITVRLADGLSSWEDLVQQADPGLRAALQALNPRSTNRLGIVDLELPDQDPAYWAERVHQTGLTKYSEVATYGEFLATSTDPLYVTQWALRNVGQTGGTSGADVSAEAAWNLSAGTPSVVVGILDSGCQVDHEDLAANIWTNDGEIPNNGEDDDGNGFIDDYYGWNFESWNGDVSTPNDHGTHVAGIIIAPGNNGVGIAGLAGGLGSPGVRGMTVKVGTWGPDGSILDESILYAADNGADVITMSLSVGQNSAINDALDYALDVKDVFIDCAAGNNGSQVGYPARRPEVMAVASTDDNDQQSGFSNPGAELEIAAPGSDIQSTRLGNSYGTESGTSFAAPFVGALAALIRGLVPSYGAAEVRQLIIDTADDVENPGWDSLTGHGRINAYAALSTLGSPDGTVDLDASFYSCNATAQVLVEDIDLAGNGTLVVTAKSDTEGAAVDLILSEGDAGVFTGTLVLGAGAHAPDGLVQVSHGDMLTVTYVDFSDGGGGFFVNKYATAAIDCAGPVISGVAATAIDDTSAEITWTTQEASSSVVDFGEQPPLDEQGAFLENTLEHSVTLTDLSPCTRYLFRVASVDALGNPAADDNNGLYYSFQTQGFFPGIGLSDCAQGEPRLDSDLYGCEETVTVTLTDLDLDTDPGVVETVSVLLTSSTETVGEWVTLTEAGDSSTTFGGSIVLNGSPASGDGLLGVSAGDLITVTYFDGDDGSGNERVASYTSLADCVGPKIENLRVTEISSTRARIEWTSEEPSTSRVDFGPTSALGSFAEDEELTTDHSVSISPFNACDRIHFVVSATDARGATSQAGSGGQSLEFNLKRIGGLVFHDNFEADTGWTLEGEWERDAPKKLGSAGKDPESAYSGTYVLGTDLSGTGAHPGDYESQVTETATTPSFDPLGIDHLELILRRKLGVNDFDTAKIELLNFFPITVWSSWTGVDDNDWVEARYDLGNPGPASPIQLRFEIESVFPGSHSYGWNIDELIVKDATLPDFLVCADCTGPPGFSGVVSVHDPDPCAATGLEIRWQAAPSWGTGSDGVYEVYRGTTASFLPDESNRIASGLTGTSWTDLAAPVDTQVWYLVRARNDEDCDGTGLADTNLVRLSATETVAQSGPSSVGESVRVDAVGETHVRLSWAPIAGAAGYIVRRSESFDFADPLEIGTTTATFFENANAALGDEVFSYRVYAVNSCGEEGL